MDKNIKKVLITGSAGLVGSACVEFFTKKGWEVVGIDNNARSQNLGTPSKTIERNIDFTKMEDVVNLFQEHNFDAVIHAGGQASHDWSNDHIIEDFIINALGTVILLEATRNYCYPSVPFVYVSTDKVYGDNMGLPHTPYAENLGLDFAGHRSPFGCSKASADMYVQEYAQTFKMNTGVFRPGCITGKAHEGAELHGFLAYLAKCIRTGTPYKIFGFEGQQVRDQIHANDLASAFHCFIENPRRGQVYNIGGGKKRAKNLLGFAELISQKVGKEFIYSLHAQRPGDREWDIHDVTKFRAHYPEWDYKYNLSDIINDVCSKEI